MRSSEFFQCQWDEGAIGKICLLFELPYWTHFLQQGPSSIQVALFKTLMQQQALCMHSKIKKQIFSKHWSMPLMFLKVDDADSAYVINDSAAPVSTAFRRSLVYFTDRKILCQRLVSSVSSLLSNEGCGKSQRTHAIGVSLMVLLAAGKRSSEDAIGYCGPAAVTLSWFLSSFTINRNEPRFERGDIDDLWCAVSLAHEKITVCPYQIKTCSIVTLTPLHTFYHTVIPSLSNYNLVHFI